MPERKTVLIALAANAAIAIAKAVAGVLSGALHQLTGQVAWDAAAAVLVGALLVYVAFTLGRNFRALLIGAGARPEDAACIRSVLSSHPGVDEVLDLRTMYVGPRSLLVAARVDLADDGLDAEGVERLASDLDERLREDVPEVSEVFVDPTPRAAER